MAKARKSEFRIVAYEYDAETGECISEANVDLKGNAREWLRDLLYGNRPNKRRRAPRRSGHAVAEGEPRVLPSKHMKRWSDEDVTSLTQMFNDDTRLWMMAETLERTEVAVADKLAKLGLISGDGTYTERENELKRLLQGDSDGSGSDLPSK